MILDCSCPMPKARNSSGAERRTRRLKKTASKFFLKSPRAHGTYFQTISPLWPQKLRQYLIYFYFALSFAQKTEWYSPKLYHLREWSHLKLFLSSHFHLNLFWIPAKPKLLSFCAKQELKQCQKTDADQDINSDSKQEKRPRGDANRSRAGRGRWRRSYPPLLFNIQLSREAVLLVALWSTKHSETSK